MHIKSIGSQTPWLETEKEFSFDSSIAEAESVAEMTYARVASSIGFITLASGILAGAVSTLNGAVIELAMWKSRLDEGRARTDCRVSVPDPAKWLIMEYCGFAEFLEPAIEGT